MHSQFGLGTSIAGLPLTLYNNSNLWYWQNQYPIGCLELSQNDGVTTCERGDNALSIYQWAFFYAPLWCAIAFATVAMLLVFLKVHSLEVKSDRFRSTRYSLEHGIVSTTTCGGGSVILHKPGERAKKVARQASCYVGAFYLTWIWSTITCILQSVSGKTYFSIVLLTAIFLPFQGFLNFLVYIGPRFERYREQHSDWSIWNALEQGLCHLCTTPIREDDQADDYNVALTEAEMRSNLVTEPEEREARHDYNEAATGEVDLKMLALSVGEEQTTTMNGSLHEQKPQQRAHWLKQNM